jgi:hypothetical protein
MGSALLAACAAPPDEIPISAAEAAPTAAVVPAVAPPVDPAALVAAAATPADAPALVSTAEAPAAPTTGEVPVVDIEKVGDTGVVCELKRRSGSRITKTVCVTREQHAAMQRKQAADAQEYARDLEQDRAMRDQQQRIGGQQSSPSMIVFQ